MSVQVLQQALQRDHALFFDQGEPVREEGWAWRYANVLIVISHSCDLMVLYRRTGTSIKPEDLKDFQIIAGQAGFSVETKDNGIAFKGPEYLGEWDPDDLWNEEEL